MLQNGTKDLLSLRKQEDAPPTSIQYDLGC